MSLLIENDRRRTFRGILILALAFRVISFLIIALALLLALGALILTVLSGKLDNFLSLMAGSAGAVAYGVALFLGSEMIRLLVGVAKDLRRISESTEQGIVKVMEASSPPPPPQTPASS
jgi:uncharacterized membrane protein YdjX (TVP38/TMEM64 family)